MRPTASPSRPYGRYAVVLRPSLDRDAYIDAPSQDQEAPKQPKANAAVVLTGPAPSGMSCINLGAPGSVWYQDMRIACLVPGHRIACRKTLE